MLKFLFNKMFLKRFEYRILFVIFIYLIIQYHEKLITPLDFFLMPSNDDICKTIPQNLSNNLRFVNKPNIDNKFLFRQSIDYESIQKI